MSANKTQDNNTARQQELPVEDGKVEGVENKSRSKPAAGRQKPQETPVFPSRRVWPD